MRSSQTIEVVFGMAQLEQEILKGNRQDKQSKKEEQRQHNQPLEPRFGRIGEDGVGKAQQSRTTNEPSKGLS